MYREKLSNLEINNIKSLFVLLLLLLLVQLVFGQKKDRCDKKLLVYASFENEYRMNPNDSLSFFNEDICLELRIDTINIDELEKVKGNKHVYKYKDLFYSKKQIFSLSKFDDVLKFKITRFNVGTILNTDIKNVKGEGNCLTSNQKWFLFNYCKTGSNEISEKQCVSSKKSCFYIDEIQLFNGIDHFLEINYGRIKFK